MFVYLHDDRKTSNIGCNFKTSMYEKYTVYTYLFNIFKARSLTEFLATGDVKFLTASSKFHVLQWADFLHFAFASKPTPKCKTIFDRLVWMTYGLIQQLNPI